MFRKALIRSARRFADYLERTLPYGDLRCKRCRHALVVCQSDEPCGIVFGQHELGTSGRGSAADENTMLASPED